MSRDTLLDGCDISFLILSGEVIRYHNAQACVGEYCCFHKPSDHHMRTWPLELRGDRPPLMERVCEHGVGHPDPDSLAYVQRTQSALRRLLADWGTHGCDGCCSREGGS